jgi:predicted ester cyclase
VTSPTAPELQAVMLKKVSALMAAKKVHDIEALLGLYHPDCVLEQPSLGVRSQGHEAIRPGLVAFARFFPDYERDFEGMAFDGPTLVSWGTARATLTGEFNGHKANGQRASMMTFVIFRFEGEKIIYEGHHWDLATLCRQSGIPAEAVRPAAAAAA